MTPPVIGAAFVVLTLAAAAQSATGFGFALIAVPLLTLVTDAPTAVVVSALVSLVQTGAVTVRERRHVAWRTVGVTLATTVVGMPLGLLLLVRLPERGLAAVIAVVVIGFAVLLWRGVRLREGPVTVGAAGVLSGTLATSTGTDGPPLVAAFQGMEFAPEPFRATLAAIFTSSKVFALAGFAVFGQLTVPALVIALSGVPAAGLGWYVGNQIFGRVDPARFRLLVLATLAMSGAITLLTAIFG